MQAFISYCHHDKTALDRLHVHLRNLTRSGLIDTWFDHEILAGSELDSEIDKKLEAADLFLLLVSPDFLASDYCVDREMKRALERHETGDARVVPVIVEDCDWKGLPALRKLKAVPTDGKAISEWANPNTAFLNVVQELRRILANESKSDSAKKISLAPSSTPPTTTRYRAKREFDDIDRADFREAAFATIKEYFRRATFEIDSIEGFRGRFFDRGGASFGGTVVNGNHRNGTAHITVYCRASHYSMSDIFYSFSENAHENSSEGGFNLTADDYELYLTPTQSIYGSAESRMTPEQAAEMLWNDYIEHAGITYG
jgi:hypothetical protein